MAILNTSIKRGSAELAVLAVLEEGPRHGYEIARRIAAEPGQQYRPPDRRIVYRSDGERFWAELPT